MSVCWCQLGGSPTVYLALGFFGTSVFILAEILKKCLLVGQLRLSLA